MELRQHLADVRARMHAACARVGRDPSSVTLVAVTKGIAVERIREAVTLGLADLGENRVQEARQKQIALSSRLKAEGKDLEPPASSLEPSMRWHLIGHLQRNKVKDAVMLCDVIHSVDSCALAEDLERHMILQDVLGSRLEAGGKNLEPRALSLEPIEVFVQVNVSGEDTKFGCTMEKALPLARRMTELPHLRLRGLMMIAPFSDDPERARPHFRRLRQLRDELVSMFHPSPFTLHLSMGMSGDYEVAIEEGADLVRIGTAIFGD